MEFLKKIQKSQRAKSILSQLSGVNPLVNKIV
jgi:hypothetical protein